jgi:hypothetical protein
MFYHTNLQATANEMPSFLHDLPKLLESIPLVEHECGACMHAAVLCEMFSATAIMTDGYGLHFA